MPRSYSIRLHFGPYRTPRFRYGQKVECLARGEVQIVKLSAARIPWPIGRTQRAESFVLFGDLARAVRRESNQAVAYWFGVTGQTVTKWRRALGVRATEGDRRLRVAIGKSPVMRKALAAMWAMARDPVRCAKIAASRRGKPRPKHVLEALRKSNLGRKPSAKTRRKMSDSHKRRGTYPPAAGRPWDRWEDKLVRMLSPAKAAERTGRTVTAVRMRRHKLGYPMAGCGGCVGGRDGDLTQLANSRPPVTPLFAPRRL